MYLCFFPWLFCFILQHFVRRQKNIGRENISGDKIMVGAFKIARKHNKGELKVSWYPKIDHVFEKYTSVIFR